MWISMYDSIRHNSCCGKMAYKSEQSALAAIVRLEAHYGNDGQLLRAYYCVFCNDFHLGRKPKASALRALQDLESMLSYGFNEPCPFCITNPPRLHCRHIAKHDNITPGEQPKCATCPMNKRCPHYGNGRCKFSTDRSKI